MSYTPGPWEYLHDGYGGKFWLHHNDQAILDGCGCCGSPSLNGSNYEDNARLIAAAPELLEALQEIRDVFCCETMPQNRAMDKARAAVKKALG